LEAAAWLRGTSAARVGGEGEVGGLAGGQSGGIARLGGGTLLATGRVRRSAICMWQKGFREIVTKADPLKKCRVALRTPPNVVLPYLGSFRQKYKDGEPEACPRREHIRFTVEKRESDGRSWTGLARFLCFLPVADSCPTTWSK
jgi:hypothetical protein